MSRNSAASWRAIVDAPFRPDEAAGVARSLGRLLAEFEAPDRVRTGPQKPVLSARSAAEFARR